MMKMFDKPKWLKPEINDFMYYVHLAIIAVVVLGILQYFTGGKMLTWSNFLWSIPLLLAGDVIAHSVLKLD